MLPRFDLINVYGRDVTARMRVLTGCKATCTKYLKRKGGRIEYGTLDTGEQVIYVWYDIDPRYCTPGLPNKFYERYILVPAAER